MRGPENQIASMADHFATKLWNCSDSYRLVQIYVEKSLHEFIVLYLSCSAWSRDFQNEWMFDRQTNCLDVISCNNDYQVLVWQLLSIVL